MVQSSKLADKITDNAIGPVDKGAQFHEEGQHLSHLNLYVSLSTCILAQHFSKHHQWSIELRLRLFMKRKRNYIRIKIKEKNVKIRERDVQLHGEDEFDCREYQRQKSL